MINKNGYGIKATRNDGNKFDYENEEWALLEVEGIDFPEIEIFKEPRGFGNGDIITGKRKHSREIKLTFAIRTFKQNEYALKRKKTIGFHDSKHTYNLAITYLGETKIAKNCVIKAASYPAERFKSSAVAEIIFISPSPDLYADNADNISFVNRFPMWHCTRVYEGANGTLTFGELVKATEKNIYYIGSEEAPITITIKATGYVNGVFIGVGSHNTSITTQLYSGDVLIIDTGERIVLKNGTPVPLTEYDAMQLMQLTLEYGDNTVRIDSSSTAFNADIDYIGAYGGM